jgi:hypothetical protein
MLSRAPPHCCGLHSMFRSDMGLREVLGCGAESAPTKANRYSCWARSQAKYILGDCGRSYIVGYGNNPPSHEHHRCGRLLPCPCRCSGVSAHPPASRPLGGTIATQAVSIFEGPSEAGAPGMLMGRAVAWLAMHQGRLLPAGAAALGIQQPSLRLRQLQHECIQPQHPVRRHGRRWDLTDCWPACPPAPPACSSNAARGCRGLLTRCCTSVQALATMIPTLIQEATMRKTRWLWTTTLGGQVCTLQGQLAHAAC